MLILFTDTDNDITLKDAKEWGLELISMPYTLDEKEIYPYEDFLEFNYKEFYDLLRNGCLPKTSAISPEKYLNYFKPFLAKGDDILYVHFSKAMSGTFNAMNLAVQELEEEFPNRKIYTIDAKGITIGGRMIVKEIARLYKENKTIEEILEWASVEVDKFATFFYTEDLKFFARSGRVSNFAAFMGNIFGIHPIIHMDSDGKMNAVSKANGKTRCLRKILKYVEALEDHIADYPIIIGHSDAEKTAKKFGTMLLNKFGSKLNIEYVVVNPTAGSHCGPDTIGVCFHAKHR